MTAIIKTDDHRIEFNRLEEEYKLGNITPAHIKWFLDIGKSGRDSLVNGSLIILDSDSQFVECLYESNLDFGTIDVPQKEMTLDYILEKYKGNILECDIKKAVLPRFTYKKFKVRVFSPKDRPIRIDQCIKFLKMKGAISIGFMGLMLILDQKGQILQKGASYFTSECEREYLEDKDGGHDITPTIMVCYGKKDGKVVRYGVDTDSDNYRNDFRIKNKISLGKGDRLIGFFKVENE